LDNNKYLKLTLLIFRVSPARIAQKVKNYSEMEKQKEEKSVSNMRDRMPNDRDVVWVSA